MGQSLDLFQPDVTPEAPRRGGSRVQDSSVDPCATASMGEIAFLSSGDQDAKADELADSAVIVPTARAQIATKESRRFRMVRYSLIGE